MVGSSKKGYSPHIQLTLMNLMTDFLKDKVNWNQSLVKKMLLNRKQHNSVDFFMITAEFRTLSYIILQKALKNEFKHSSREFLSLQ